MQKKYNDIIINFLKDHPLISERALEKIVGAPQSTIGAAKNGSREIPVKHIFNLLCELSKYGLKIEGYSLEIDKDTYTLFGRKFLKEIEVKEESGHFTYTIQEARIIINDFYELP